MPSLTGTLDQCDQRLDWLLKFSISTSSGTVWLGAKTKGHQNLVDALTMQQNMPPESRPMWEIEYEETNSQGKNGKTYTNRDVISAHTVEAQQKPAANGGGGDRDAAITRAVAFKGAIEVIVSTKPKTKGQGVAPMVNELTEAFVAILDGTYEAEPESEPAEITVAEEETDNPLLKDTI